MQKLLRHFASAAAGIGTALAAGAAFAQEAAEATPALDTGDTAWMLISTVLVAMMIVPALGLFYGGLVRTKNMLSVLVQVFAVGCLMMILWVLYGYSLAFTDGNAVYGGLSKAFLAGITPDSLSGTIPEMVFVCFQMTFAGLTPALILGAFAERVKFSAVLWFTALWFTFSYVPMAHMVWGGGWLQGDGALDFAGGTVVHINAGVAGLVGCIMIGKRVGYGKEAMPPHSLTLTMVGAALLWMGWFGFNAGSAAAAGGGAALAMINTFTATAGAALAWLFVEWAVKGKASLLGIVSGVIAGLVAVTPAAGFAGPVGSIVLGAIASVVCFFFCTTIKNKLGYDDSLDVFNIHGVGGIIGSILTGVLVAPSLGGTGIDDFNMGHQLWIQTKATVVGVAWSAVVSAVLYFIIDKTIGLRVTTDEEREGLDLSTHGERAYHY
ncbi:ammonium transporter [Pedomonas sp. V897]|uniref:ammonium transporter n=1 Tax=Pedomonas sp. V897 TaxID=3446482 RepID=UPI003EE40672